MRTRTFILGAALSVAGCADTKYIASLSSSRIGCEPERTVVYDKRQVEGIWHWKAYCKDSPGPQRYTCSGVGTLASGPQISCSPIVASE